MTKKLEFEEGLPDSMVGHRPTAAAPPSSSPVAQTGKAADTATSEYEVVGVPQIPKRPAEQENGRSAASQCEAPGATRPKRRRRGD